MDIDCERIDEYLCFVVILMQDYKKENDCIGCYFTVGKRGQMYHNSINNSTQKSTDGNSCLYIPENDTVVCNNSYQIDGTTYSVKSIFDNYSGCSVDDKLYCLIQQEIKNIF